MDSSNIMIACVALAALVALLLVAIIRRRGEPRLPVIARPVMTKAEIAFFRHLVRAADAIGGVDVFPQVSMGAIMEVERGNDRSVQLSVRNRFDRKIVDFLVVDADTRVKLIVELDDRTHDAAKDRERDAITASAGYRTLRIRGAAARDPREVERLVRAHLT